MLCSHYYILHLLQNLASGAIHVGYKTPSIRLETWSCLVIPFLTALEPSRPISISLACAAPDALLPISPAYAAPAHLSPDPPPSVPLLHRRPSTHPRATYHHSHTLTPCLHATKARLGLPPL
jgi:hypothetical protein